MTADHLIAALELPADARVDQRVPKKLLVEQGAPTAADKRRINAGVEQLLWIAALKPTNIGVPEYRDGLREYLEIAVLRMTLRPEAKPPRLIELIHRAIPYPVILVAEHAGTVSLSLAHKRWSQGEAAKTVLDGEVVSAEWKLDEQDQHEAPFLAAMPLAQRPRSHLYACYQDWIDCCTALAAARITGVFAPRASATAAGVVREALAAYEGVDRDLTALRSQAHREKQLNRRVELNLNIKRLETELAKIIQLLRQDRS